MKKNLFVKAFSIILIFNIQQGLATNLVGKYAVGSFLMKQHVHPDSLRKSAACDFGKIPFNFQNDSVVKISSRFGKEIFGDSIFRYKVTKKNITFINDKGKIIIPYVDKSGIIRIMINHRYLKRLDLCKIEELR
jgi:hypothetical protein